MITLNNLTVSYGGTSIIEDVSFMIGTKDKIGLVGKNGAGKTTLLKIIAKEIDNYSGNLVIPKDTRIGYLPQEKLLNSKKTVYEEAYTAFDEILEIDKNINNCIAQLQDREDYQSSSYISLTEDLENLNNQRNILGGESNEADIEKILKGLGFQQEELHKKVNTFSGGWQMRVELAKVLLKKPDIVLLDEPTNHLDIESIQWVESFLSSFPGIVIIVSHDRAFLDNVTRRTIEIVFKKIEDYKSSYSNYVLLRKEKMQHQIAKHTNQQKELAQIEEFITRFRYKNTKAKQVKSKIKYLDRIDKVEIEKFDTSSINFVFPPAPRSGKIIVEAEDVAKSFGEKEVFSACSFGIQKDDKIAFIGQNGRGKTTLSRMIVGELEHEGMLKCGHNVKIGYYAQNETDLLDSEKTVFQVLDDIAVGDIRKQLRNILGSFLFSEDDIDKKVKVLSGGEKSRLAIAKLLLEPVNFLILDEPTNHLDMQSKDILKNALLHYDGTLIIVSHDRDFLQGLTERIFEFKNGNIKQFTGDINGFLETKKLQNFSSYEIAKEQEKKQKKENAGKIKWQNKKEIESSIRKLQNKIKQLEKDVEKNEQEVEEIDIKLSGTHDDVDFENTGKERHQKNLLINNAMEEWDVCHKELGKKENELKKLMNNE